MSVRIHNAEEQRRILRVVGLTDEEIKAVACKFIEDVTESFGKAANPKTDPAHTDSQEQP